MRFFRIFVIVTLFITLYHNGFAMNFDKRDSVVDNGSLLISLNSSYQQFHLNRRYSNYYDMDYKGNLKNIGVGLAKLNKSKTILCNASVYIYEEHNYLKTRFLYGNPVINYSIQGIGFNFSAHYYPNFFAVKIKQRTMFRIGLGGIVSIEKNPFFIKYSQDNQDTVLYSLYKNNTLTKYSLFYPKFQNFNSSVNTGVCINFLLPLVIKKTQLYLMLQYSYIKESNLIYFHNPLDFSYYRHLQSYSMNLLYNLR